MHTNARLVSISVKYGRKSGSILDILQLGLYRYEFHGIFLRTNHHMAFVHYLQNENISQVHIDVM